VGGRRARTAALAQRARRPLDEPAAARRRDGGDRHGGVPAWSPPARGSRTRTGGATRRDAAGAPAVVAPRPGDARRARAGTIATRLPGADRVGGTARDRSQEGRLHRDRAREARTADRGDPALAAHRAPAATARPLGDRPE